MISPGRVWSDPHRAAHRQPPPAAPPDDDTALVRPYLMTGGRTRPVQDGLRVETLVSAVPASLHAPLTFERRRIVELCQAPRSVAEIAVALMIPFGVTKVLVADLVNGNFVTIQQANDITIDMLERIRDRVRSL
ncbi:DUF742 domain-containing protein [Catellatospora sp. IY07-71]|uniref:DUF742 domain-containing protein n=1 Tax=Catellatospora sp. IY07-71 TaxID=2728827 RepID=UPI0021131EE0|nr:DUF742 domain-containing protein [Catellatospora sp. IY07-71]